MDPNATIEAILRLSQGSMPENAIDILQHTLDYREFRVGDRVEIHPGCDLWMRGARFGTIPASEREA